MSKCTSFQRLKNIFFFQTLSVGLENWQAEKSYYIFCCCLSTEQGKTSNITSLRDCYENLSTRLLKTVWTSEFYFGILEDKEGHQTPFYSTFCSKGNIHTENVISRLMEITELWKRLDGAFLPCSLKNKTTTMLACCLDLEETFPKAAAYPGISIFIHLLGRQNQALWYWEEYI